MKTLIYLVRHGHSAGNLTRTMYGHHDGPLTDIGHRQALRVADYFQNKLIDAIYSSDLTRAVNTIRPTALAHGLDVIRDARLRELSVGRWENRALVEIAEEYPVDYSLWLNDRANARCPGGESVRELQARIFGSVTDIVQKNIGKTVIIATHATPIWVLKASFCGVDLSAMNDVPFVPNASISAIAYENGAWSLLSYGEDAHLSGLVTLWQDVTIDSTKRSAPKGDSHARLPQHL